MSEEEIKKVRADPSMPFAPSITPTTEQSMVPGMVFQILKKLFPEMEQF